MLNVKVELSTALASWVSKCSTEESQQHELLPQGTHTGSDRLASPFAAKASQMGSHSVTVP